MKQNTIMLTGLSLLTLAVGFSAPYAQRQGLLTSNNTERPAQDLLFLHTYTNFAWGVSCWANVITADGCVIDVSDAVYDAEGDWYDDWSARVQENVQTQQSGEQTIPDSDLEIMYSFVNAGTPQGEIKDYGDYACDYGSDHLYLLELQPDGSYDVVFLCMHGDMAYCLDDENTKKFCNWMIRNKYFTAWEEFP